MKKVLVIGINKKAYSLKRILEELKKRNINYSFFKWGDLVFTAHGLANKNSKINLKEYNAAVLGAPYYDLVVTNKKRKAKKERIPIKLTNELHLLAQKLAELRLFFINRRVILGYPYYDKFNQADVFSRHNIPHIPTLHLTDNGSQKAKRAIKSLGWRYPLIVKKSFGGLGLDVFRVNNSAELETFLKSHRNKNLIYQPYLENDGDYRILVCGNKALGIMKRKAARGDWKNNFSLGGTIEKHEDSGLKKFSEELCKRIGFDFAGVDVIKDKNEYRVIEVNLFPGFQGFEKVFPEIDVAREIVTLLLSQKK